MEVNMQKHLLEHWARKPKQIVAGIIAIAMILSITQLQPVLTANAANSKVTLNYTEKTLKVGDEITLKSKVTKKNLKSKKVIWKSSQKAVATVTQKGVVKAKKEGTTKITATIKETKHKATCTVIVKNNNNTSNNEDVAFTVNTTVRLVGDSDKSWKNEVDAKIGDKVEFRIEYENTSDARQNNVAIADILPSDLHYVKGTTKLYNGSFPKGFLVDSNEVVASGIYVGHYEPGANAIIRFQAEVVDDDFTCGKFILHNWGRASIGEKVMQDSAAVVVQLPYCPDLEVENPEQETQEVPNMVIPTPAEPTVSNEP